MVLETARVLPGARRQGRPPSNTAHMVTMRAVVDPTIPFGEDTEPRTKYDVGGFVLVVGDGGPKCEVAILTGCGSFASVVQEAVARKFRETDSAEESVRWLKEESQFANAPSVEYPGHSLID